MVVALKMAGGTSPEGKLAELKAQRTELLGRAAGLAEARQRLGEAEETERAAAAALAELDAVEIAAARKWASTGAVGAAPSGEIGRRTKLVANLASAQAAAAAARGAGAGLDTELAGLRAESADLAAYTESVAIEIMECERVAAMKELESVAAHAGKLLARVRGHVLCLGQRGRDLRDAGHADAARAYFVEAEKLGGLPLPDPQPPVSDIDAARLQWQRRFGELKA